MLWIVAVLAGGPISQFDHRPPVADYVTSRALEDVERCLIDLDGWGAPSVYRQPDAPDKVTLIWFKGGTFAGLANARLDLERMTTGTRVRSWMPAKQAKDCAPA